MAAEELDDFFRGAGVAVAEVGFRVAGRPALGMEVVDVEVVLGANGADGVTCVLEAAEVVALFTGCLLYTSDAADE